MALRKTTVATSPVLFSRVTTFSNPEHKNNKAFRAEEVLQSTVTVGDITINTDEESMDRFDRVLSLGIAQVMLATSPDNPAWDAVTFPWKGADNKWVMISIRQAIALQEEGLNKLSETWAKY